MATDTELYDRLFDLYTSFDTESLRVSQEFVDLLPPMDSLMALDQWEEIRADLDERRAAIAAADPDRGETLAEIAARATRDQAFTALDLYSRYGRGVNALVLDVDETLRSAGNTDNEIPRDTLYLLTRFHDLGIPIVICTGQTLENVKGFLIQGLGNEVVYSGDVSIVYEAGTGVFTPGHGPATKQLLYEDLADEIRTVFGSLRSRVLQEAPDHVRKNCHLQGNEFNVTLKPNFETGSDAAREVIDEALVYLVDLLADCVTDVLDDPQADLADGQSGIARRYYAERDPEIHGVLAGADVLPTDDAVEIPTVYREVFDRLDVAYYEADAAEVGSLELNKVAGVQAAFDVLEVSDPFALVMGDSKSDLRVMEWLAEENMGIAAAPTHASGQVLDHVRRSDDLVFDRGNAAEMLRTAYALNLIADLK